MERSCFSEKTLTLSVLTAEFARCVLQTGAPVTTRSLFFQGLPMALALVLITALTTGAEQRANSFWGTDLRSRVVCGGLGLWFVWEAVETFRQAQELCWENFSSMAMLGLQSSGADLKLKTQLPQANLTPKEFFQNWPFS